MTEWQKAQAGFLYDANYDEELIRFREKCADLCYAFNQCRPSDTERKNELLHCIFGEIRGEIGINAPFYCDYGFNIRSEERHVVEGCRFRWWPYH